MQKSGWCPLFDVFHEVEPNKHDFITLYDLVQANVKEIVEKQVTKLTKGENFNRLKQNDNKR